MLSRTPRQQVTTTTQERWTTTNSEPEAILLGLSKYLCFGFAVDVCDEIRKGIPNEVRGIRSAAKSFRTTPAGKLSLFAVLLFQPRHRRELIINDCTIADCSR